jgi:hypothetical protein
VDLLGQNESLLGWNGFDSIYPGSILALVILCHPPYREKACCSGFREQLLKFVDGLRIAMLTGSKDALLESVHVLFELAPGQLVPTLTHRIRLMPASGCLRL